MATPHPSIDDDLFEQICEEIEQTHKGLVTICKEHNKTAAAFYNLIDNNEEKSDRYACAKSRQADYLAELILEVSFDDGDDEKPFVGTNHITRDRLKADSLKYIASKLRPKKYGDKIDVTSDGKEIKTTTIINLGSGIKPDEAID